jgi:molybdopterin-guanine dinucleotide biosynthesis protein A
LSLLHPEAEGFVLAGGRSSRMERDKALVELAGRSLIERALGILRNAGIDARIAGARSELSVFAPVILDLPGDSGQGPLAGICAALSAFRTRYAVFLPVDLPLIPASLIEYLVQHVVVTGAAVTVVSVAGFIQTFPAIIDRAASGLLKQSLDSGNRNCLKALQSAGVGLPGGFSALQIELLVQPGQVSHPRGLHASQWFLNVNSPADLLQLNELAKRVGLR